MPDTPAYRLPETVAPERYDIRLTPDLSAFTFAGEETVAITVRQPVTEIVLNAIELTIHTVSAVGPDGQPAARHGQSERRKRTSPFCIFHAYWSPVPGHSS